MAQFPPMPEDRFFRNATVYGVVDGDTIDVTIDVGWSMFMHERLRLEAVNTPETRGDEREAGLFVKQQVIAWLPKGTEVVLASVAYDRSGRIKGKYGRTVAHIWHKAEGWCLNARLLDPAAKLAWETDHNGSLIDERRLTLLTGLPADLRPEG